MEQATLELRSFCASDGVAFVAVALLVVVHATLELRSSCASEGVASVVVALRVKQATLELRSTSASDGACMFVEQATVTNQFYAGSARNTSRQDFTLC